jgi:tRNA threonylcarbamoyladenosine biosynthesis protein TsaE
MEENWKKAFETDLEYIVEEVKELIATPSVIILSGPLGAGKTTFARYFFGKSEDVASPTYSMVNEHGNVLHADFYRIENDIDLIHLELPLYLEGKKFFVIEWGKSYLNRIQEIIDDETFSYYEVEITNGVNAEGVEFRNYHLSELKN